MADSKIVSSRPHGKVIRFHSPVPRRSRLKSKKLLSISTFPMIISITNREYKKGNRNIRGFYCCSVLELVDYTEKTFSTLGHEYRRYARVMLDAVAKRNFKFRMSVNGEVMNHHIDMLFPSRSSCFGTSLFFYFYFACVEHKIFFVRRV